MTRRSVRFLHLLFALLVGLGMGPANGADRASPVIVNGVALSMETLMALQRIYPVPIQPGRYWYDAVSGAYGVDGGPVAGQMSPGLRLGGSLRADASRGTSRVFINGRQLTNGENPISNRPAGHQLCRVAIGSTHTVSAGSRAAPSLSISRCAGRLRGREPAARAPGPSATRMVRAGRAGYWDRYSLFRADARRLATDRCCRDPHGRGRVRLRGQRRD